MASLLGVLEKWEIGNQDLKRGFGGVCCYYIYIFILIGRKKVSLQIWNNNNNNENDDEASRTKLGFFLWAKYYCPLDWFSHPTVVRSSSSLRRPDQRWLCCAGFPVCCRFSAVIYPFCFHRFARILLNCYYTALNCRPLSPVLLFLGWGFFWYKIYIFRWCLEAIPFFSFLSLLAISAFSALMFNLEPPDFFVAIR